MRDLIELHDGEAMIGVRATTPRIRLTWRSLRERGSVLLKILTVEYGVDADALESELSGFIYVSAHASDASGLDFELATLGDDDDTFIRKFNQYLDTELGALLDKVAVTVSRLDNPAPVATSHTPLPEDAPKNSSRTD